MLKTYPGADGMKTGFTDFAGHNLVTSAVHGNVRLIGVVLGAASNSERDQNMAMILDDGFARENAPSFRFAGGLISLANATPAFSFRPPEPRPAPFAEPARAAPRTFRDHGVQVGPFQAERHAWEVSRRAAEAMPNGEPRVQPILERRHTAYLAQLLGVSESEARTVCASLSHRGPGCTVFRIAGAQTAAR
jgi:D-alanyl-D-alanine carboxypeptidase